jgi:hypothetical protein
MHQWHSEGAIDAHTLGLAVIEALDPKTSHRLAWLPNTGDAFIWDLEDRQIVVVYRKDHETLVGTPVCPWGKAPTIALRKSPKIDDLGNAILTQVRFSAAAAASFHQSFD